MWDLWIIKTQHLNLKTNNFYLSVPIHNQKLLSQLEIDEVQQTYYSKGEPTQGQLT